MATRLRLGRSTWSRRRCPSRSACLCTSVSRSRLSGACLGNGAGQAGVPRRSPYDSTRNHTRNRNLAPCRHFDPRPSGVPPAPPREHSTPVPVQLTRHGHVREPFHACVLQGRILDVARGRLRNVIGRESSSSTVGNFGVGGFEVSTLVSEPRLLPQAPSSLECSSTKVYAGLRRPMSGDGEGSAHSSRQGSQHSGCY